jgi:ATP-dependent helicase/nuclease subunit A
MKEKLTVEQRAAIEAKGKIIVSASAGSGKTFVMIQKLSNLIEDGGDLDEVLAVTFTKKAAAQMKEKLRTSLISRIATAQDKARTHIKSQLNKIQSSDISTIHSFCSHLVRTYFYALDIDSSFDIIADDDAQAMTLKYRAMDNLFDRLYDEDNANFKKLLSSLRRKRSDDNIKFLLLEAHKNVRMIADYEGLLTGLSGLYTEKGFNQVCAEYKSFADEKCRAYLNGVRDFRAGFTVSEGKEKYDKIFDEMEEAIQSVLDSNDIFAPLPKLYTTTKPRANDNTRDASEQFSTFRDNLKTKFESLYSDLKSREEEREYFFKSGELSLAFADILLQFDREYAATKRDEGKLDYNDLEHFTLKLLSNEEIKAQINSKYKYVFVDEYQDVNPVQEKILSEVSGGDSFTVGDVKQAIYGFRGSKSLFFAQKYHKMMDGEGQALKLSNNFRSSDGVINFVNDLFSRSMSTSICGFDYKADSVMLGGGGYPAGYGSAQVHVFGKDEEDKQEASGIYSVKDSVTKQSGHSREGLAVLDIVKRELSSKRYDLKSGQFVDVQTGDICILTRKRSGKSVTGIVRALTDAGYSVCGAKQSNICDRAEVKQILDILSYIDNCQQDIPLASALLSPVGGFTEEELATIKIEQSKVGDKLTFREYAINYATTRSDPLAHKLAAFFKRIYYYRRLSDILGAAKMIDKILSDSGLSAKYAADGGEKLAGIRRLEEEAYSSYGELHINAFLNKIKAGGYKINAPVAASSDSIKIMTMHASKGLEFPVVIIADASATFKGRDISEMPFDDKYGFSPKYYDEENRLQYKTLLARLCKMRISREEIKNELNLFYVACTRAMCSLHIMTEELKEYDPVNVLSADCYAQLCDFSAYTPEYMQVNEFDEGERSGQILISQPDESVLSSLEKTFECDYAYESSINLPIKSSASELLKMSAEDNYYAENIIYPTEEEEQKENKKSKNTNYSSTSAEVGTAYHRYLQLCDFSIKDRAGIAASIQEFVKSGLMPPEQAELLNVDNLVDILSMSAFNSLGGCRLYREREFLCKLPANQFLNTPADDGILIQGAIDLLAVGGSVTKIIDYKYSKKNDEQLKQTYFAQLALYKKAVAAILKIAEENISTTIINIHNLTEINL